VNLEAALGFLVAAVRETFEEAGVLLATRRDGTPLTDLDLSTDEFVSARKRLGSRAERWDWSPWLREQELTLDLDGLVMWAWWVTPVHSPYRFDTRFFAAVLPEEQVATHDRVETTDMRWTPPDEALRHHEQQLIELRDPTVQNLRALTEHMDARAAVAAARRGAVDRRRVQPRVVRDGAGVRTEYLIGGSPQIDVSPESGAAPDRT